jgi:hypothetical protein
MKYRYQLVDRVPAQLDEGIVYHTEEFELAALLCACGCGHRVTLLVPDSHEVWDDRGYATIRPSIGVFDGACKSHYFISSGDVEWLPAFTGAQAAGIMHAQIARHVASDGKRAAWWEKARAAVLGWLRKLAAFLTG